MLCSGLWKIIVNVVFRTSPEVAYERLKKRGRKEEAGVPMEFIQVTSHKLFVTKIKALQT